MRSTSRLPSSSSEARRTNLGLQDPATGLARSVSQIFELVQLKTQLTQTLLSLKKNRRCRCELLHGVPQSRRHADPTRLPADNINLLVTFCRYWALCVHACDPRLVIKHCQPAESEPSGSAQACDDELLHSCNRNRRPAPGFLLGRCGRASRESKCAASGYFLFDRPSCRPNRYDARPRQFCSGSFLLGPSGRASPQ